MADWWDGLSNESSGEDAGVAVSELNLRGAAQPRAFASDESYSSSGSRRDAIRVTNVRSCA
jgi:hypothetical protein